MMVKNEVEKVLQGFRVEINIPHPGLRPSKRSGHSKPLHFTHCLTTSLVVNQFGKEVRFPQMGAFEVYFKRRKIFSKLKTSNWPNSDTIIKKIQMVL